MTAVLGACAGCKISAAFHCDTDPQCGAGGTCQTTAGYCSFADTSCGSGLRYDDYAGDGLAGTCVGADLDAAVVDAVDAAIDAPPVDAFPPLVIRLNEGGGEVVGVDYPGTWTDDAAHIACSGNIYSVTSPINGTVDDALFQDIVYGLPTLTCAIPALPSGMYQVRLLFAELFFDCPTGSTADHQFNVALEGAMVGSTLSSRTDGGGCATTTGHPYSLQTTLPVTDGQLDITVTAVGSSSGAVSAIEVIRVQ